MNRPEALRQLGHDPRYASFTAGEALDRLSHAFQVALEPRDLAFFAFHRDEPCHEVARACAGGHRWRGDESRDAAERLRRPHWHGLEQMVLPAVIRKN